MANTTPVPPAATSETSSSPDPVAQTLALIQPWIDYVPPQQRRLGLFIFIALLAHLTMFFFISIDTTRAELRHQLRPHVTVESSQSTSLSGQSPGDQFWDQMNDPRLFLLPQPALPGPASSNPALDFNSVGAGLGSSDLPPTAPPEGFQFVHPVNPPLDQRVGDTMNPARQSFSYDENPPAISPTTTWRWDDALAQRQPMGLPSLPSPISDTDLNPTQMRISVGPGGAVEDVMVEQSCGKAEFDQQAALAARKIRFLATDESGLLWGRLTVFWHYSAKPREEVVPTPPSTP
jgi:TonB family protein